MRSCLLISLHFPPCSVCIREAQEPADRWLALMDSGESPGLLTVIEMRLQYICQKDLYWLGRSFTLGPAAAAYWCCFIKRTMTQSPTFMRMHGLHCTCSVIMYSLIRIQTPILFHLIFQKDSIFSLGYSLRKMRYIWIDSLCDILVN